MEQISLFLKKEKPAETGFKGNNNRAYLLSLFAAEMPEMKPRTLAIRLAHCKEAELFPFFQKCKGAEHFGKFFNWSLKVKR